MHVEQPQLNSVLVLRNVNAGAQSNASLLTRFAELLDQCQLQCEILDSPAALVESMAAARSSGRLRAVVSAGGDGTLQLVAGLCDAETPIAIFPLGTENLAAKHFGYTAEPMSQAELICRRHSRQVDAGEANGRLFVVMVSCGFDARVVRLVHEHRRGNIRKWHYAGPIAESFFSYRFPRLEIRGTERVAGQWHPFVDSAKWAFVFNVPRYASGLQLVPTADPFDGCLELRLFRGGGRWKGIWHLLTSLFGFQAPWTGAGLRKIEELTVSADEPVDFQIDGDPGGQLPVTIRVLPKRITLLLPAQAATCLGTDRR